MKFFLTLTLCLALASCTTRNTMIGNYYYFETKSVFPVNIYLKLEKDSFTINYRAQDASPQCTGNWRLRRDTINLKCYEEKIIAKMLSKGYMNKREYQIKIINKDSLKLINENVILKRR